MQTFLFNINTQQREGPIRDGRYLVDGLPGPLPDFLVELTIEKLPDPSYDPANQTLEYRAYVDLPNAKWIEESYVRDLTDEEKQQRLPKPPNSCSPRQLRIALIQSGISISTVESQLNAISDPVQREIALVEWEYSLEIQREHPLVSSIATALSLSDSQIDDIFILANTL
jgi:hypothetical protein